MWHDIEGHDRIAEQFRAALARDRLASTFLFVGPPGVGKKAFAIKLAESLLCQIRPGKMDPCGECHSCRQVKARSHPDLILVAKPPDKNALPLALFIGDGEKRNREGLCHDISLRPHMGERKVAIIDDADLLGEEGANALLKTLEEPPPRSVLILIGTSADSQLPTIRSRAQIIRFRPLPSDVIARLLLQQGIVSAPAEAERLARYSEGSLSRARDMAAPELWSFRQQLLDRLADRRLEPLPLAKSISEFVDAAGKEGAVRRARLKQVLEFAAEFYRQLLRQMQGGPVSGDAELQSQIAQAQSRWHDLEALASALERTLEAIAQIQRFVHQATLIESWLDDLSRVTQDGRALPLRNR